MSATYIREAVAERNRLCPMSERERLAWYLQQKWRNPMEGGVSAVLMTMGLAPPFVVTEADFEHACELLRNTPRQIARTLKLLADQGIVAELPASVRKRARAFNTVSDEVRARIFERDKVCQACGTDAGLTIDHIKARCLGGENDEANLQVLCLPCNCRKAAVERKAAKALQ